MTPKNSFKQLDAAVDYTAIINRSRWPRKKIEKQVNTWIFNEKQRMILMCKQNYNKDRNVTIIKLDDDSLLDYHTPN